MLNKPLEHQKQIFEHVKDLDMFGLDMEFGTGKSYCNLNWIEHNQYRLPKGVLIVGKKINIIPGNIWETEIKKHTKFSYTILTGSFAEKKHLLYTSDSFLYLISYDSIKSMFPYIVNRGFSCLILDESTQIKNIKAKRTKIIHKLKKHIPYRIIAAGDLVTEDLKEIWSQFHMIDEKNELEPTYWNFLKKYFYPWKFGWGIKQGADKKIMDIVNKRCVNIRLKDCMDLPKKLHRFIPLIPTSYQSKMIKDLKFDFECEIAPGNVLTYSHVLPILMKMRQICSGFIYLPGKTPINFNTPKKEVLLDIVSEITQKKIIWCVFKEEVNLVKKWLDNPGVVEVVADQSENKIKDVLHKFKTNKNYHTLVTTYSLMESGENLTVAPYSIHFSLPWSNGIYLNAKGRIYRKGSEVHEKIYYIHLYLKDTIEEKILELLRKKKSVMRNIRFLIKECLK